MNEDDEGLGLLGQYGVVIIPPSNAAGQWFVTLAGWNDESESYVGRTDGPIRETREEALEEAGRVMEWLATQPHDSDLLKVWEQMQQELSPTEIPQARHGFPWG